jgi:hypothetical protein
MIMMVAIVAKEKPVIHPTTDVEDRKREDGNQDVSVPARGERFLGEWNIGESSKLPLRGIDSEVLDRVLYTEEIVSHAFLVLHDFTGTILGCEREAAIPVEPYRFLRALYSLVTLCIDYLFGKSIVNGYDIHGNTSRIFN